MAKIAIIGCKRVQDKLCIACEKCLKAIRKKDGQFAQYDDDIELVALGDCGDCPGLILPKITLINDIAEQLGEKYDVIHFGTCVLKAKKGGECPLDFEKLGGIIKENFGKEVVFGTHNY